MQLDDRDRVTVLVHYHRALVGRADIWRMRMDATTNWAIGATAAVSTFALGNAAVPHYVVFIAPLMTVCFLMLEARRLTFYHLWQQRVLLLERSLVRPALTPEGAAGGAAEPVDLEELSRELAPQLGLTAPTMPIAKAAARRLRRVYLYLLAIQLLAWSFKLANHPAPVSSLPELVDRARAGVLPGEASIGLTVLGFTALLVVAAARGGVERKRE